MKDSQRLVEGPKVLMDGRHKRLVDAPRSVVLLVCLCLLGLGIAMATPSLLFAFGDETAKHVNLVFLADLNGDDHQDAFLVTNQMQRILFNDGTGNFMANRELLIHNYALALGDLDGNGSLDAILSNFENGMMGGELITECAESPADLVIPARSDGVLSQVFAIRDGNRDGLPEGMLPDVAAGERA